jgi:integrase
MYTERVCENLLTDENGRVLVSLVERSFNNGKTVYYGRFTVQKRHLANNQRFIMRSLRTNDFEIAKQRAFLKWSEIKIKNDHDDFLTTLSVNECINKFMSNYESNLKNNVNGYSQHMFRGFRKNIDIYWRDYVGDKDINSIKTNELEQYEIWRNEWARITKRRVQKNRNDRRYKEILSKRTIQWEINAFKQFLRWCASKGFYSGQAYEWRYKAEKNRRSAFTREQYQKLYRYMRTHDFLNKGKHKNDARIRRHRHMLRAYILFMANTGLRVGEARHLRWGDITETNNKLGKKVLLVKISENRSKVRKNKSHYGNVVGRYTALRALERLKKYLIDLGEKIDSGRYIFCNKDGSLINNFREGYNNVISEAGVSVDRDGNKHTIYSLRHTYITFRLQFGKNISIHSLAKNCRTSVSMIEQFYSDAVSEDFVDELSI